MTEWPVVLLPSHRSYLDFILVTYIMFEHNISLPCIAAGQGKSAVLPEIVKIAYIFSRLYVNAWNQSVTSP